MSKLFTESIIKGLKIKNRVVFPPVVCFFPGNEDGFVTQKHVEHYRELAENGVGLIIAEATCVSRFGKLDKTQLGLWDDKFIPGLRQIADAVHESGCPIFIQIHHAGLKTVKESCETPFAPSDYSRKDIQKGWEMTAEDIDNTIRQYAEAAARAEKAGFDGVELHGCHAYLISQFLSPSVNTRTDAYGQNRAKFGVEAIQAVKAAVSPGFVVGIRTSGNDPDMKTSVAYAKAFVEAGVDYLHVSTGFTMSKPEDVSFDDSLDLNWIAQMGVEMKKHVSMPVMCVNGMKTPEQAAAAVESGKADFAAVAKGMLADPAWAKKAQTGELITLCKGCVKCQCFNSIDLCVAKNEAALKL